MTKFTAMKRLNKHVALRTAFKCAKLDFANRDDAQRWFSQRLFESVFMNCCHKDNGFIYTGKVWSC